MNRLLRTQPGIPEGSAVVRQFVGVTHGSNPGTGSGGQLVHAEGLPRLFVLSPATARRACVAIAMQTGWGLRELMDLDGEALIAWLEAVTAQVRKR